MKPRRSRNRFRLRAQPRRLAYSQTSNVPNGGRAVFSPKGYSIRPPPLLAKGSWGVLRPEAQFFPVFDPSKSLPGSSAQSALPCILPPPLVTFFSVPCGPHKFSTNYCILCPTSSKNDTRPKSEKKRSANLFEKHLQNKTLFEHFRDTRTLDPLAQAQSDHVFPFSAPNTKHSSF